jgi:hypothetical protein
MGAAEQDECHASSCPDAFYVEFHRVENTPARENVQALQFENPQVRITRVICAPGQSMSLATWPSEPSLLVEFLRFDFKTAPIAPPASPGKR